MKKHHRVINARPIPIFLPAMLQFQSLLVLPLFKGIPVCSPAPPKLLNTMSSLLKISYIYLLLTAFMLSGCSEQKRADLASVLESRPTDSSRIYDQTGIMDDLLESTEHTISAIHKRYDIEIMIAALTSLGDRYSTSEAAELIFNKWQVGRNSVGGGVLLLLIDDTREVKLEVSYELEGIYTDLFTGTIERNQLRTRYSAGELEIGLIALLEELEARAQLMEQEIDVADAIAKRDARYLSGGGGSRIVLDTTDDEVYGPEINQDYPAGETVAQAWNTLLRSWRDGQRDPNLGLFLPTGRLAYRDFTSMPKGKLHQQHQTFINKSYDVYEDGDYAVIVFGNKEGWDNAPFLFCRTQAGWQFDLVHQRRFIRMGPSPTWGVEFGEHPYMDLLWDAFRFYGQDIYFSDKDRYQTGKDKQIAQQIRMLERDIEDNPQDVDALLQLGRLYAITSMSRKAMKTLKEAEKLQPDDHRIHTYLALAHVNGFYQYESALKALKEAEDRGGITPFTANLRGFIHYKQKRYTSAAQAFKEGLALEDNGYGHFYLAFTYAWLIQQETNTTKKAAYQNLFSTHAQVVRNDPIVSPLRRKRFVYWKDK